MSAAKQRADTFKDKGNIAFKEGNLLEASELYAKAEAAAPQENVYPANLSAALYEMGDYLACLEAISRSWKLSGGGANIGTLALRLSTRAAKALAHGIRGGTINAAFLERHAPMIAELETVASQQQDSNDESARVWREWRAIATTIGDQKSEAHKARVRLATVPIARRGVNPMLQYYTMGQDEMLSLFDDWGPRDPYPLKINTLSKTRLSELSFLFGGIGDVRNMFATLVGAHRAYKGLPKDKRSSVRIHLTLLDIHPSALARDLVVLLLLNDCMTAGVSQTTLAEIKATLMYTYAGAVMPPYAHARQQRTIKSLQERLAAEPPRLPAWLHVNPDAIPALLASLAYWETTANNTKTARGMLAMFNADSSGASFVQMLKMPGLSPSYRAMLQKHVDTPSRVIKTAMDGWGPAEARALGGLDDPGWSDKTVMEELKKRRAEIAERLLEEHLSGNERPRLNGEAAWFKVTHALLPPKELWERHPEIEHWNKNRKGKAYADRLKSQLRATIENSWKPNMTLFDREYSELSNKSLPNCKGYPDVHSDGMSLPRLFDAFNRRFGIDKGGDLPLEPESPVYMHTTRFFQGVIDALTALDGSIKLEIILGGLMEELGKMNLGTGASRPAKFPRKFTRAYLSNIPDYTHGVLNTAVFVVPCLQEQPESAVASNCLVNSGIWKDDAEFNHNYSLLHPKDIPKFLGCETIRLDGVMGVVSLRPKALPRPIGELVTRAELTRWLTRVLLYTCIPGTPGMQNVRVRMPNNLVVFVRLLAHLHAVGYPAHWLAEFLHTILSDSLVTDVAPYLGMFPIPLSDLTRSVPSRRVRLDPWLAEFENILVTSQAGLPFAVSLPREFARNHTDIAVYEAVVQLKGPDLGPMFATAPVQDPVVDILLYKPSKTLTVDALARLISGILEGGPTQMGRGTLYLLSSQEVVDIPGRKVSWRLSRDRVRTMRAEGWVMVVYRTDNHEAVTFPLPANKWTEVVDVPDVD
ncbi:hypothetical protein C8F04DRAFT_994717 [Mycena alexandri]|uniref:DUF4470 domain-containing protein n=1 Tax=Mycena alexandri TaxID=1745969 RepID=A0AAD6XDU2_9AGAR|nr:hypothetical protein C8F04DRAFT_994717 [Mycena alexandri]